MATKLIFRSGLKTIGGTIIELIDGNTRLIFDIGMFYDPASNVSELPNVEGLFDGTSKYDDHVLVSHLHLDHTKAMNLVHNDTKVIMASEGLDFYQTLVESGFDQIEGSHDNKQGVGYNQVLKIGNFEVTFIPVDHDVLGASAILIKNEDLNLFYSGDLRIGGRNYDLSIDAVKNLKDEIDVSIFEGVTVSFIDQDYDLTPNSAVVEYEHDFASNVIKQVNQEHCLLFNPYIMAVERIKSIVDLAKLTNKTLVILPELEAVVSKYVTSDYQVLGRDINLSEITTNHMLQFSFKKMDEYKALNCQASLIQTGGEPLGDYDPNYQVLLDFCQAQDIKFLQYGISGHGNPNQIAYLANEVAATYLMPLHSFKPELLKVANSKQLMPRADHVYEFENHNLID